MKSHREQYPEQYQHELVGERVAVGGEEVGTVTRVFPTRFGSLACVAGEDGVEKNVAYALPNLEVLR